MSGPSDRTLYLDNSPLLCEALDDSTFRCNAPWWEELSVMWPGTDGETIVAADDAAILASLIELRAVTKDEQVALVKALASFLRGGPFVVVNLAGSELQN